MAAAPIWTNFLFILLLALNGKAGKWQGLKAGLGNPFPGHFADAVGASFDALQGFLYFVEGVLLLGQQAERKVAVIGVGSGVGLDNVREFYDRSDGVLIGEVDFKVDRVWGGASDEGAYAEAVRLARG